MTLEYVVVAVMLVCNLVIASEWARFGLWELGLQRPINARASGAGMVGMLALVIGGLAQKYGHFEFQLLTEPNLWKVGAILYGPPLAWLYIFRHLILPAGLYDHNRATMRTRFWTAKHYRPGRKLFSEGELLKSFPPARQALQLFKRAIEAQEKGTRTSVQSRIIDLDEVEESYRGTVSTSCPNCGAPVEVPVQVPIGDTGQCQLCGCMLTVKRIGNNIYLNCFGATRRTMTKRNRLNVAIAYDEMGLLYRMMNRFDEAQEVFQKSLALVNSLLEGEPTNREYLTLQSLILFRQAEAFQAEGGHSQEARALYLQSLAIDKQLGLDEDRPLIEGLLAKLR